MSLSMIEAALRYATVLQWSIFPLGDESKIPITAHGYHDATTDPEIITRWWTAYPTARIGVACRASGFIVIDEDPRNGGTATLDALEVEHGPLPRNNLQRSGSGGHHILMRDPSPGPEGWTRTQDTGGSIRGKCGPGVDVKCNGYIVVEPSGAYEWLALDPSNLAPVPEAWIALLRKPEVTRLEGAGVDAWATSEDALSDHEIALLCYDLAALGPRGGGGNTTFRAIKTIFHAYGLGIDDGAPYLIEWNDSSGNPHSAAELERQLERIACDGGDEYGRGIALGRERLRAWFCARVPPAPTAPTRDEIEAAVKAAQGKLARSSKPAKIVAGKLLGRVLRRQPLTRDDEDASAALVDAAIALVKHAPVGTMRGQIVEMLAASALGIPPDDIAIVVAEAQRIAAHATEIKAERIATTAAGSSDDAGPVDDDALRTMLLPSAEDGGVKCCGSNIELILRHASDLRGRVRFNALTKKIEITAGIFAGEHANGLDVGLKNWLERAWNLFAPVANVGEQLLRVARTWGAYDPVAEYLDALEWDGIPRVDTWLEVYCNAVTDDAVTYVRRVGAIFLIAACARALKPGSKVDTVLVFEGVQGLKKSTALDVLGGAWFSDTPLVLGDKDSRMLATSKWIVELAELSSLKNHSDVEQHKAFLSARKDNFRPPYGRVIEEFDRRCVFAGTTNASEYLHDTSGARRFHPVKVGRIDIEALTRDRDQLWAEATARYRADERWWFELDEQGDADEVADERRGENPWTSLLLSWWTALAPERRKRFTLAQAAQEACNIDKKDLKRHDIQIASSLREAGFVKRRERVAGRQAWYWTHGDPSHEVAPEAPPVNFGRILGTRAAS